MAFGRLLQESAAEYGLKLDERQLSGFSAYYELLLEWNQKINLTAITEPQEVAVKHIIDSLSCFDGEIFTAGKRVIDVGAGAGFPGLPLAIWQPNINVTLLDSLNKRVKFLQAVIDVLQLSNAGAVHGRAEEYCRMADKRESYDIAVSRAVARLNVLAEYCMPYVKLNGYFIALKGAKYQEEIQEANTAIKKLGGEIAAVVQVKLPQLEDKRAVIYVKKIGITSNIYPRKAGIPEKKPL